MDLNLLDVFVAVAERHSFTEAAEALGLSRSVVSRRVAALEEDLGVQLLHRTTRHVEPTSAGQRLLRDVAPLLGSLHDAVEGLPEAAREPAGELRITAPADLGQWLLPPVLGALTTRYPGIHPVVFVGNRVVDLEREGFDVALRVSMGPLADSDLRVRRLGEIGIRLYGSPAYLARRGRPERVDDLVDHTIVGMAGAIPQVLAGAATVSANDMLLAAALARHGVGLAMLPTFLVEEQVAEGALEVLLPEDCFGAGTLYAVFPSSRVMPPKSEAFRDAVVGFLREHPLEAQGPSPGAAPT